MFTMRMRVQRFSGLEVDNQLPTTWAFLGACVTQKTIIAILRTLGRKLEISAAWYYLRYIKRKDIIRTLLMRYVPT
jgi:hypothetical protein